MVHIAIALQIAHAEQVVNAFVKQVASVETNVDAENHAHVAQTVSVH